MIWRKKLHIEVLTAKINLMGNEPSVGSNSPWNQRFFLGLPTRTIPTRTIRVFWVFETKILLIKYSKYLISQKTRHFYSNFTGKKVHLCKIFREISIVIFIIVWKSTKKRGHDIYGKITIFSVKLTFLLKKFLNSWFHENYF